MSGVIRSFRITDVFEDNTDEINSTDFSSNGRHFITSSEDNTIAMYDCIQSEMTNVFENQEQGTRNVKFARSNAYAVHSVTRGQDHSIKHFSLLQNKYINNFIGHSAKVVSLCVSPTHDMFVSGSLDRTVKIWDLRSSRSNQGTIDVRGNPLQAFNPNGVVLAVGVDSKCLQLYDMRWLSKGPYLIRYNPQQNGSTWIDLKISLDGCVMVTTTSNFLIGLIDTRDGAPVLTVNCSLKNDLTIPIDVSFTLDSKYVFSGSEEGFVHVWNTINGKKEFILNGSHPGPIHCVKPNPLYMMLATTCKRVTFWFPCITDDDDTDLVKPIS